MKQRCIWTTQDEINFIKTLGAHREKAPKKVKELPIKERLRLLKNYKKTMPLQARWGKIDPCKIAEVVDEEIRRLEALL